MIILYCMSRLWVWRWDKENLENGARAFFFALFAQIMVAQIGDLFYFCMYQVLVFPSTAVNNNNQQDINDSNDGNDKSLT